MTELLPSKQDVDSTESPHKADFTNADHTQMSASASKNLKPYARKIVKAGPKDVYRRIWEALQKLQDDRGRVVVRIESLIYIVHAAYPDHQRPKVGEVEGAVVYGQYIGLFKRRAAFGAATGTIRVSFPKGAGQ